MTIKLCQRGAERFIMSTVQQQSFAINHDFPPTAFLEPSYCLPYYSVAWVSSMMLHKTHTQLHKTVDGHTIFTIAYNAHQLIGATLGTFTMITDLSLKKGSIVAAFMTCVTNEFWMVIRPLNGIGILNMSMTSDITR
jgi:hypothetical protein